MTGEMGGLQTVRTKSLITRRVADDRFEFESRLEDVAVSADGGWREVIHHLVVRGTVGVPDLVLADVTAAGAVMPYGICPANAEVVSRLSGRRIGPGYRRAVLDLMGGTAGCTHFLSLALELSQLHTLVVYTRMREVVPGVARTDPAWMRAGLAVEPGLVNACSSLAEDSPVITAARTPGRPTVRSR